MELLLGFNSVHTKLLAVVLPLIVISLLALFAVLEYISYNQIRKDVHSRLIQNTEIQALALSDPLWNYDIQSIRPILNTFEQDEDFLEVRVVDHRGAEIHYLRAAGTDEYTADFTHSMTIKHFSAGREEVIGKVIVSLHDRRLVAQIWKNIQRDALILLMLISVTVTATVIAAERTIGIPVRQLLNSIQLVKNRDIRIAVPWQSHDELGEVVVAYNAMLEKQEKAEAEIKFSEEKARKSEKRLRDAVDSMTDGFALFDEQDALVLFNAKFLDVAPAIKNRVKEGVRYQEIIRAAVAAGEFPHEEENPEIFIQRLIDAHRIYDVPGVIRIRDGRWILCTQHETSTGGVVAVRTDITELKHREIELQLAKDEADMANQAKSRFLANMSHELRTPLNAILGFSDVIRQDLLGVFESGRYREYADDIYSSGKHLLDLINDILDMAKIESDSFEPDEENLDITLLVNDSIRLIEQSAFSRNLVLERKLQEDIPKVFADRRALKQVFLNLLANAVKFTPDGGRIVISSKLLETGGVEVSVKDNGPGIGHKEIEIVMRPFGRLENARTKSTEGTGLGLPLSDMLVKAHGGKLVINSQPDQGTDVAVRFPPERSVYS